MDEVGAAVKRYLVIARHGSHVLETVPVTGLQNVPDAMFPLGLRHPRVEIEFIDVAPVSFAWMPETVASGGEA